MMRLSMQFGLLFGGLYGCATMNHVVEEPCWDAQPTAIDGAIFVAPAIVATELPDINLEGFLGEELEAGWAQRRIRRTAELAELPYALADALPGELHDILPSDWQGHFRPTGLDKRTHRSLIHAALTHNGFHQQLATTAQNLGGGGTLFIWVTELDGHPLTKSKMSGEMIFHNQIPVLVGQETEPYKVEIALGAALFDADGTLAFRYRDHYSTLLSETQDLPKVASELAESLVDDLRLIWPQAKELHKERLVQNH